MLSIGLMSGTSMDGIDAALLETDGKGVITELGAASLDYEPEFKILLKAAEFCVRKFEGDLPLASAYYAQGVRDYLSSELKILNINIDSKIKELNAYLGMQTLSFEKVVAHSTYLHSLVVKKLLKDKDLVAKQIDVVGYHGQTLFHRPSAGITIQVGDGASLAKQLGIAVVNDFRSHDVALGGQGAPFAPIYHQALAIRDKKVPVAVVNCGGIANITLIRNNKEEDLIGFDTGPGNGLIDSLVRQRTKGVENQDTDGKYGKQGRVDNEVLETLYLKSIIKDGNNYFETIPPKSLDYRDLTSIPDLDLLSLEDACRTLEAFTADTIVNSLELLKAEIPQQWILAGGGWKNPVIKTELEQRLIQKLGKAVTIQTAEEAGWNGQALEAQIFAYLAVRSLHNQPISVPGTTRVPEPVSGGRAHVPNEATTLVKELVQANPDVLDGYRNTKVKFCA